VDLLLRRLRSGVWADPSVIASTPVTPIVVIAAKEARPGVVAEMVEMPAIKTMAAGHATNVTTHATDVAATEAAAHATDVASAEAACMATTATKATSVPAATATGSHQDEWMLTAFRGCVCWKLPKLPGCATAPTAESASANAPKRPDVIGLCFIIALHPHVFCAKAAHLKTRSPSKTKSVVRAGAAFKLRVDEGLEWQLHVHCILY
jgi:hypothetical protein